MSPTPPQPVPAASAPTVQWTDPNRHAAFMTWLNALSLRHGIDTTAVEPASADASFRRYLRVRLTDGRGTLVIMDAPPPLEDVRPFTLLARRMEHAGLPGPRILEADEEQGFLLLNDLGSRLLLAELQQSSPARADDLMREVGASLVRWQQRIDATDLPAFDEPLLQRELDLFPQWCVAREFGVQWTQAQRQTWDRICRCLIDSALAQPTVAVHRDWMPRNLMLHGDELAILDFQDAVRGPITYDVASMLRDAFISWDEEREIDWAVRYWQQARAAGLPVHEDFGEFWRALEWMGLQRHLKVLGIFCRLKHRDGKARYAQDLPRFFAYATKVALRYRELAALMPLIEPLSGFALEQGYTLR